MQERHHAEPEAMATHDKIQKLALKILFSPSSTERVLAKGEWHLRGYDALLEDLTAIPDETASSNKIWHAKAQAMMTPYQVRPVIIYDNIVTQRLLTHLRDLTQQDESLQQDRCVARQQLTDARRVMAKRIFADHLKYDIICLQEADYLSPDLFPEHYEVRLVKEKSTHTGIAWNKDKFQMVDSFSNIFGGSFAVLLRHMESGKTVCVASSHLRGCNPFRVQDMDSLRGDQELQAVLCLLDSQNADLLVLGMDSNVTATHPRLQILKDEGYHLDYENYLDSTCTNPHQVLNTRIDWIAMKSFVEGTSVTNIPVLSVGLNSIQTNLSDHRPIAAKIRF